MTQKVFVVTKGEYSDYRIVAIFSTRERAEQLVKDIKSQKSYGDHETIEEWTIDKHDPSSYIHRVSYDSKYDCWDCDFIVPYNDGWGGYFEPNKIFVDTKYQNWVRNEDFDPNIENSEWKGIDPYNIYTIYINTSDRVSALKIGTEKIMQKIAKYNKIYGIRDEKP